MEPAAKRPKPSAAEPAAASASVAALAALDAEIAPLEDEAAEFDRRIKELKKQRSKLTKRVARLHSERQGIAGALRLLADKPELRPGDDIPWTSTLREYYEWTSDDAPVSTLGAAHQRLAIAAICHARLSSATTHVLAYDPAAEQAKEGTFGPDAARARMHFRSPAAAVKPEAVGFLLEGCPQALVNGAYRLHSERDGWPVLISQRRKYCSIITDADDGTNTWVFSDDPDDDDDGCYARINTQDGSLPLGACTWQSFADAYDDYSDFTLTITLLRTEAELLAAERPHRIELSSDIAEMVAFHIRGFDHHAEAEKFEEFGSEAAEARQQFRPAVLPPLGVKPEVTGFLLEGHHKDPRHNGVYRLLDNEESDGWPVLRNAHGICCVNSRIDEDWFEQNAAREGRWCFRAQDVWGGLYGEKTWSYGNDRRAGAAGDGFDQASLPVGRHTWTEGDGCDDPDEDWLAAHPTVEFTVTLLLTRREVREAERRLSAQAAAAKASEATSG